MADARCMAVEPSEACLSRAAPAWTRRLAHDRWTPLGWILRDMDIEREEGRVLQFYLDRKQYNLESTLDLCLILDKL